MTRDRMRGDELPMTHDTLARMLGVRRPTVSQAAEALRERGLIAYTRGKIVITDRAALQAATCEHYAEFQAVYDRLLGPALAPRWGDATEVQQPSQTPGM
jgi:DNA-binding transcriptional regulator YhcF (GntR family)